MTKAELVAHLAETAEVTKKQADAVLTGLANAATTALAEGEDFTIPEIGKLKVGHRAAREGRNPKTGEPVEIAAKNTVKFAAAKRLKDAVA